MGIIQTSAYKRESFVKSEPLSLPILLETDRWTHSESFNLYQAQLSTCLGESKLANWLAMHPLG